MSTHLPFEWTHNNLVSLLSSGKSPAITHPMVLNAFNLVNRADFLLPEVAHVAYLDKPIPLAYNELAPAPSSIAKMLSNLEPVMGGKYLVMGAGTGYTTALLAASIGLAGKVYSLERIMWLWEKARENLKNNSLQLNNVEFLYRNGNQGLADVSEFDGIVYTYAPKDIPNIVKWQAKIGGKIIYPSNTNNLVILTRTDVDEFEVEYIPGFAHIHFGVEKEGIV